MSVGLAWSPLAEYLVLAYLDLTQQTDKRPSQSLDALKNSWWRMPEKIQRANAKNDSSAHFISPSELYSVLQYPQTTSPEIQVYIKGLWPLMFTK